MNAFNLYEAYAAVYDEDLREDILSLEEDFEFIDELSDNELDQVMEEILSEGVELSECVQAFDEYLLSEETEMQRMNRLMNKRTREKKKEKASQERSQRRAERVERIKSSAKRAAEKVKTTAAGAASAVAGGASEAGRKAKEGAKKVSGKLAAAKEKIKGFMGRIGRAAKAGAKAAKKEFSGEAEREARARSTGREMRRAARRQASAERSKDTSAFEKSKAPVGTSENPRIGKPAPERKALPAGKDKPESGRRVKAAAKAAIAAQGSTSKGVRIAGARGVSPLATQKKDIKRYMGAASKTVKEDFEILAEMILEDLINEGYADTFEEALYVLESFSDYEVGEIAEGYLVEETEVVDLYDVVLEHLLEKGYADSEEAATVIMANMSEEWREEIVEANRGDEYATRGKDDRVAKFIKSKRRNSTTTGTKRDYTVIRPRESGNYFLDMQKNKNK